jgi:hypothetical protein
MTVYHYALLAMFAAKGAVIAVAAYWPTTTTNRPAENLENDK